MKPRRPVPTEPDGDGASLRIVLVSGDGDFGTFRPSAVVWATAPSRIAAMIRQFCMVIRSGVGERRERNLGPRYY